jgi:hypothetical protein
MPRTSHRHLCAAVAALCCLVTSCTRAEARAARDGCGKPTVGFTELVRVDHASSREERDSRERPVIQLIIRF